MNCCYWIYIFLCLVFHIGNESVFALSIDELNKLKSSDESYAIGEKLLAKREYSDAANAFWRAVLLIEATVKPKVPVNQIFQSFMNVFQQQNKVEEGYLYVAREYLMRNEPKQGVIYLKQSLAIKPTESAVILLHKIPDKIERIKLMKEVENHHLVRNKNDGVYESLGNLYFELSDYEKSLQMFKKAYTINPDNVQSFSSAVYLRSRVCDWGPNGLYYHRDMKKLQEIIENEMNACNYTSNEENQQFNTHTISNNENVFAKPIINTYYPIPTASVVNPHAALGFPLHPLLKKFIAQSHADAEKQFVLNRPDLSKLIKSDYYTNKQLNYYRNQSQKPKFRIKIGYVSASIKSKALIYLSQSLITYHNKDLYEIHLYSVSAPDSSIFIQTTMRGVDWREKMKNDVEYFHDVSSLNMSELAHLIRGHGIHILVNWDGYSHNGMRATGLFPLQIAPLQISHQEYLGTLGADYIQYIITDKIVSPLEYESHYTEKFIHMPYAFFMNSCSYQKPQLKYPSAKTDPTTSKTRIAFKKQFQKPLSLSSSSPATAVASKTAAKGTAKKGGKEVLKIDFIYCNFNKHLKFNPTLFTTWLDILSDTSAENTILLLLENPKESKKYIYKFINGYNKKVRDCAGVKGSSNDVNEDDNDDDNDDDDEEEEDEEEESLNYHSDSNTHQCTQSNGNTRRVIARERVIFYEFIGNPYDNQHRVTDLCDALIDTPHYNSHTTAVDALWGGVPIVALGNDDTMAGRVTTSILTTLNVTELIADDYSDYARIAINLAIDRSTHRHLRKRIIDTCLEEKDRNPFWNMPLYARNLEHGYTEAWRNYLQGNRPRHITVDDQRYQPLTTRFDFKNLNDDDEEDEEEVMSESQSESRSSVTDRVEEQEEEEDSMADDDYGYGDETDIYLKYMD